MLKYYDKLLKKFEKVPGAVIVYGSVAEGKSRIDSDIDIAIISKNRKSKEIADEIADEILFKTGKVVSIIHLTPNQLRRRMEEPFVKDMLRGEVIHGREILKGIG